MNTTTTIAVGIGFLIIALALTSILSIVALVIGINQSQAPCDDTALVPLSTWLIVYGSVGLGSILFSVLMLGLSFISPIFLLVWGVITLLIMLFNVIWNIIGAISLFRDSMSCQNEAPVLWITTLIILILQWIGFLWSFFSWGRGRDRNEDCACVTK